MVASLKICANYFCREQFSVWNPATGVFGSPFYGRQQKTDTFVTLYNKSTRRRQIFVKSDQSIGDPYVIKRLASNEIFIVSETKYRDFWLDGEEYFYMMPSHLVMSPSGGAAQFISARVAGSGNDLGPVVLGTAVNGYADVELRTVSNVEGVEQDYVGQYFVVYSRNFSVQEGDYILLDNQYYRIEEDYKDSGFYYSRAVKEAPTFTTLDFKIRTGTLPVYDPTTGTVPAQTEVTRQVSALIDAKVYSGVPEQRGQAEKLSFNIRYEHIGFTPELGQEFVLSGKRYAISRVDSAPVTKQWKMEALRQ